MAKEWVEKVVEKFECGMCKSMIHPDRAAQLVKLEHARAVRICRQARMLKFHGLRDTDTNEWLDGYEAACNDILTALQRGRGGKG